MKNSSRREFVRSGIAGTAGVLLCGTALQSSGAVKLSLENESNEINILDFGAVPDGKTMNTAAIQKAIDSCARKGGGKVIVPGGTFLTGGFSLKSNVNLHLTENAVILGSPYLLVKTRGN